MMLARYSIVPLTAAARSVGAVPDTEIVTVHSSSIVVTGELDAEPGLAKVDVMAQLCADRLPGEPCHFDNVVILVMDKLDATLNLSEYDVMAKPAFP